MGILFSEDKCACFHEITTTKKTAELKIRGLKIANTVTWMESGQLNFKLYKN